VNSAVLGTVGLGGVAALDAVPLGQTMLSQPLVTATLVGLMWGDLATALEVGVVLQLIAASTLPVGARTPEDYASGGVIGSALALVLAAQQPYAMARESSALLGCIAGMLSAAAGVPLIKWQRRRNEGLARWCEAELRGGRPGALAAAQWAGASLAFAVGVALTAAGLALGAWALGPLLARESLRLSRAWTLAQPLWIGLGLAQLISAFIQRRLARAALFGAALITAWLVLIVGMRS